MILPPELFWMNMFWAGIFLLPASGINPAVAASALAGRIEAVKGCQHPGRTGLCFPDPSLLDPCFAGLFCKW